MAKRKKTDTVQLKLRLREALRRRLETAARAEEVSLNTETVRRLENSFLAAQNANLLEALLVPGKRLELLRAISVALEAAGPEWDKRGDAMTEAISKLVAIFTGRLQPVEASFPRRNDKATGDYLAWLAVLVGRFHLASKSDLGITMADISRATSEGEKEGLS